MKMIPTAIHGMLDYVMGAVLIFIPEIFGFTGTGSAAVSICRVIGVLVIMQGLLTDYELGLFRIIRMKTHLMNDYIAMGVLTVSPWLFGFSHSPRSMWLPQVIFGLAGLAATAMTDPTPGPTTTGTHMFHPGGA